MRSKEVTEHLRESHNSLNFSPRLFNLSVFIPKCTGSRYVQSILFFQLEFCIYHHFPKEVLTESPAFPSYASPSRASLSISSQLVLSNPYFPGVFFYLSSAVNPIIYNLLSRRFQAAFRNVISPPCKRCHSQDHPQGPGAPRNIFLTDCHLVELTEDAGPQVQGQPSTCNSPLSTAVSTGQAP